MKNFQLTQDMLNIRGQFYPTGHVVAMFPSADAAQAAAQALMDAGWEYDEIAVITPEVMLRDLARTVTDSDSILPSPGTESDTVRRYAEFARNGHHGLLIHCHRKGDDQVMQALRDHQVSHAQKYRALVIEDLA
ncbi:MAG TPA: hypothetical protein VEA40_16910 [Ramlibacter sp.]|nr:hypothetical protein [Ramlibacter sp.]